MSYEIIYDAFCIKKENKYIPFIIEGSNNCFMYSRNREVRERNIINLNVFYKDEYKNISEVDNLNDIIKYLDFNGIIEEYKGGNIQGISLNTILKRIKKRIIDNKENLLKSELTSLYYFKEFNKDIIKKIDEFEEKMIKKLNQEGVLFREEKLKILNDVLNTFDIDFKNRLLNWLNKNNLFFEKPIKHYTAYEFEKYLKRRWKYGQKNI